MNYTQREVQAAVHARDNLHAYWGSHRATEAVEREVIATYPGVCDSPVISYPYSRLAYFMNSHGELVGLPYEDIQAHPIHVNNDPRNYSDDELHFMKFPLTSALDES